MERAAPDLLNREQCKKSLIRPDQALLRYYNLMV